MRPPDARRAAVTAWAPAVAALLAWPLTLQHLVPPARWAAGLLLAFLLPGLAATAALFFGRALSTVERTVLAPALSLAVLVFGGLLLNAIGIRLTAGSWAALTAFSTVALAGVGYLRWWQATDQGSLRAATAPDDGADRPTGAATRRQLVLKLASLAAVILLLVGASWIAMTDVLNHRQAGFTALSIVQADDSTPNDAQRPVDIAVDSHEATTTQYFMQVRGAKTGVLNQFTISLVPGQVWKARVQVPFAEKVTAVLFKGISTTPYRTVFVSGLQ